MQLNQSSKTYRLLGDSSATMSTAIEKHSSNGISPSASRSSHAPTYPTKSKQPWSSRQAFASASQVSSKHSSQDGGGSVSGGLVDSPVVEEVVEVEVVEVCPVVVEEVAELDSVGAEGSVEAPDSHDIGALASRVVSEFSPLEVEEAGLEAAVAGASTEDRCPSVESE